MLHFHSNSELFIEREMDYVERRFTELFKSLSDEGCDPSGISHAALWCGMRLISSQCDPDDQADFLSNMEELLHEFQKGSHDEVACKGTH